MKGNIDSIPYFTLNTGDRIPCIGLGTFGSDRFEPDEVSAAVEGAIRAGYRCIDCASVYGNEKEIGRVLRKVLEEGVCQREDLFLMSKVWNDMHREVRKSALASIEDLGAGYLDMLFIHWPFPNYHAPHCDGDSRNPDSRPFSLEEFMDTYRQLEELKEEGIIRNIGISNMTIPKLDLVKDKWKIKPSACESEMHPLFQQQDLLEVLNREGILSIAYMPLGSPKRPERDIVETDLADMQDPELVRIAHKYGVHPAIICLKWAHQRGTLPIPFSLHNYEANLEAMATEKLTEEEMALIGTLEKGNRLVKGQVFLWAGRDDWHALWDEDGHIADSPDDPL